MAVAPVARPAFAAFGYRPRSGLDFGTSAATGGILQSRRGRGEILGRRSRPEVWLPKAGRAVYDYYVKSGPVMPGFQNLVNVYNMNFHPTAVSREATLNGILHSGRWEESKSNLAGRSTT